LEPDFIVRCVGEPLKRNAMCGTIGRLSWQSVSFPDGASDALTAMGEKDEAAEEEKEQKTGERREARRDLLPDL